jgi:hypothetical protein
LVTDRVDKVWAPMESLYPPGKQAIPAWFTGEAAEQSATKENLLVLPEGARPTSV